MCLLRPSNKKICPACVVHLQVNPHSTEKYSRLEACAHALEGQNGPGRLRDACARRFCNEETEEGSDPRRKYLVFSVCVRLPATNELRRIT